MNITRENTGKLTATLKINVTPADYNEKVNKVLKDYQRKANIPGFRPGHVPFGLIRKMYGSAVFADEVNKLVSDAMFNFIREEKLEILGQPLPNTEKTPAFDWNDEQEIDFYFDLGISPSFDLKLDPSVTIPYHRIKADDKMVQKYSDDLRKRYGKITNPDRVEGSDVLIGTLAELAADGDILKGGITRHGRIALDTLKDKALKNSLTGMEVNGTFDFLPLDAIGNETEVATLLGVKKDELEGITSHFRFTIEEISRVETADLDEEFFEQVFPGAGIKTEDEYWAKLRRDSEDSFTGDSDHLFMHHVQDALLEAMQFDLPAEFLKRWLVESNEGKLTPEDVENDFGKYARAMRWQLIENRIIRENGIKVDDQEIRDQIKDMYFPGWRTMDLNAELAGSLEGMATNFLTNNSGQSDRIMDAMYDRKVAELVKSKVTLEIREITYDEFITLDAENH